MIRFIVTYVILGIAGISTSLSMETIDTEVPSTSITSKPVMIVPSGVDYLKGRIAKLQSEIIRLEGDLERETSPILSENLRHSIIPRSREELKHLKNLQQIPNTHLDGIVQHLYTIRKIWKSDDSYCDEETSLLLNLCKVGVDHSKVVGYAARLTPPLEGVKIIWKAMFSDRSGDSPYFDTECRSMMGNMQCYFIGFFAENWTQQKGDADYESLLKSAPLWFLETDNVSDRIEILKEFLKIPTLDQTSVGNFSTIFIQNGKSSFWKGRNSANMARTSLIQSVAKIPPQDRLIVMDLVSLIFKDKTAPSIVSNQMWEVHAGLMIGYLSFLLPKDPGELRDNTVEKIKSLINSNPITSTDNYEALFQILKQKKFDKENVGDCVLF